jgi:hypothetical protein
VIVRNKVVTEKSDGSCFTPIPQGFNHLSPEAIELGSFAKLSLPEEKIFQKIQGIQPHSSIVQSLENGESCAHILCFDRDKFNVVPQETEEPLKLLWILTESVVEEQLNELVGARHIESGQSSIGNSKHFAVTIPNRLQYLC